MKILVVEDDRVIAESIRTGLVKSGFAVDVAGDGAAGSQRAGSGEYSLVILDLMLPKQDGWSVCQTVRARRDTVPILMLTARDAVEDRIRGLEAGADDYLPKPFHFGELLARVRALLRRDKVHKTRVIRIADLEIDTAARRVTRAGRAIALTPREYTLLEALAANEGRILSHETIQERVWRDDESYTDTPRVHITTLRRKVDAGFSRKLIHTVYGAGYVLRAPAPEGEP